MIDFRFILNPNSDPVEIEEPPGWSDIAIEIVRDAKFHGIGIAYGVSDLQFIGWTAGYLQEQYELYGIDAQVEIEISAACEGEQWQETFRLDFGQYEQACGDRCSVKIGIEQASCFVRFNDGMDKKVDLDSAVTFDGATPVPDLPNLRQTITLPAKSIMKAAEGSVAPDSEPVMAISEGPVAVHFLRPFFTDTKYESLKTSQLKAPGVISTIDGSPVSPLLLYDDDMRCFSGTFDTEIRLKGTLTVRAPGKIIHLRVLITRVAAGIEDIVGEGFHLAAQNIVLAGELQGGGSTSELNGSTATYPFDVGMNNPALAIASGEAIYALIFASIVDEGMDSGENETRATFDPETHVRIQAPMICPATQGAMYMPFETIQRVTDIITNGCLRVESTWYGRTDTPTPYGVDGCGAFRAITGGLHLRGAPGAKVFLSMKEWFEGMQPVDANGFALERDEQGGEVLRVEYVDYFYQDIEILRRDNLLGVRIKANPDSTYGTIKVGYEKWQAESVNGLDEFNSTREYRSSVAGARAPFEQVSKFIAGGYLIELARIQSFAQTGAADTAHDNDIFLIQLKRDGGGGLQVEQGVPGGVNIFDPPTVYNWRLSPLRNLLRWWPYVSGMSFRDIYEGLYRFAAGTGNYTASGLLEDDCSPEETTLSESETVTIDTLKGHYRAALTRAETVTFETTLSLRDFKMLQANPYGYISFQCGTGEWRKGYIQKVTYRPKDGNAAFELRSKYE